MKNTKSSAEKMIISFDKELRNLLLTDLKVNRVAKKNIDNSEKLLLSA